MYAYPVLPGARAEEHRSPSYPKIRLWRIPPPEGECTRLQWPDDSRNPTLQLLLVSVAGWMGRRQQEVIEYLIEENRVLKEQLGGRRLRLTDDQRRRLAAKGKLIGRRADRISCISMLRLLDTWREALHIVQPDTVVRWHRRGYRYYWRRKSNARKIGRPSIGWELVHLRKRQSRENALRGAPKIAAELVLLGHEVGESSVARYMVRHRPPARGQRWRTFLASHMDTTIACDFFTMPTITFRNLFVFVVLHHGSRRIVHVKVTEHPTAEWTAQQLVEALGDEDAPEVSHVVSGRDASYGDVVQRKVCASGIENIVTPKASPRCNGFAESVSHGSRTTAGPGSVGELSSSNGRIAFAVGTGHEEKTAAGRPFPIRCKPLPHSKKEWWGRRESNPGPAA